MFFLFQSDVSTGSKTGVLLTGLTLVAWTLLNRKAILIGFERSAELFPGNRHLERNLVTVSVLCITLIAILSIAGTNVNRWQEAKEGDFASLAGRAAVNAVQIEMTQDPTWGAMGFGPG